jgi:hypothetical protein
MQRFFNHVFLGIFLLFSLLKSQADAKSISTKNLHWLEKLQKLGINQIYVCGSSSIQLTERSLLSHFFLGKPKRGFFVTQLFTVTDYWKILEDAKFPLARQQLEERISKSHLWEVTHQGNLRDLGTPTQVTMNFTKSVRDCIEGENIPWGLNCSQEPNVTSRRSCCKSKFKGPEITYGSLAVIKYSPDPSVRLKVKGEKLNRYCNFEETIDF